MQNAKLAERLVDSILDRVNSHSGPMWKCRRKLLIYWSQMWIREVKAACKDGILTWEDLVFDGIQPHPNMSGKTMSDGSPYCEKIRKSLAN